MKEFRRIRLSIFLIVLFAWSGFAQSSIGIITTVAGNGGSGFSGETGDATSAGLVLPYSVAVDSIGNLWIADAGSNRVRKVTIDGIIATFAGGGTEGFGGDGGSATDAQLLLPVGIALDGAGNLLIADSNNNRVRRVTPAGIISTVAGNGAAGFGGDGGTAVAAQLFLPYGVAMDVAGNLFIADTANNRVRKVTPDGIISIVAGNGTEGSFGDGGLATFAELFFPAGVAVDRAGNLLIADTGNNRIRKVTPDGFITTVAGNGTAGFSGDAGAATSAQLTLPNAIAVDSAGNLFIADTGNNCIRKVTPAGIITTVAGNGTAGFGGDGRAATSAQLDSPSGIAIDGTGNLFIADSNNERIRKVTYVAIPTFSITDRGGTSSTSLGTVPSTLAGYGGIQPDAGSSTPSGLAIFGFRENGILVSEAGVPATPAIQSGRIYAEVNGLVDTGLAIANPNSQPATVTFYFTGSTGNFGDGSTTIPANGQIAVFLDQPPFNGGTSLNGAFTFSSSIPVAVIALLGLTNERGEFLMTTLPVADLSAPATSATVEFPHFADGGGWTTQVVLVNPGDTPLTGIVQFRDLSGQPAAVSVSGQSSTSFAYSIPARSSQKLQTSGATGSILTGSVRVVPSTGTVSPSGLAIFSFRNSGTTVAEAGVPAVPPGTAFRLYAEASGQFGAVGSIQTGFAIANASANVTTVTLELSKLDGSSTGLTGTVSVPGNGQVATFLNQIQGFASLQTPFQGVLRVSSSASISVTGLRGRYNERRDFLITTTPATNEAAASSPSVLYFPHIVDGGGYTTQFILFSGLPRQVSSGTMQLFTQAGAVWGLQLQ